MKDNNTSTFDLRNGKTLNRKTISFDGTLLSESFLKPLFGHYDKYRCFLSFKIDKAEQDNTTIDLSSISDSIKLKLSNKRVAYILVEETILNYPSKYSKYTKPTSKITYHFHRVYSTKDLNKINGGREERGYPLFDNFITNHQTSLDDNRFGIYYDLDGYYKSGLSVGVPNDKSLKDYIDTVYDRNIIIKDIIYSEV